MKIIATNGICHNGTNYLPGEEIDIDEAEGGRLIDLGAAADCGPVVVETPDLFAQIAAATTVDELAALMPKKKPAADVQAAFEARMKEIQA